MNDTHPVAFSVDYPDRALNRLTTALRIFTAIPIAIVLGTIGGYSATWGGAGGERASTVEEQGVHLDFAYPDARQDLNRWLPLVKWFLAIPHYIVLFFFYIGVVVLVIVAWFAILFTGRYPRGMFDY